MIYNQRNLYRSRLGFVCTFFKIVYVQFVWILGTILLILSVEIMCYMTFGVITEEGYTAGIRGYSHYARDLIVEIMSFLANNHRVYSMIDGNEIISKKQDKVLRICSANKVLYHSIADIDADEKNYLNDYEKVDGRRQYPYSDVKLENVWSLASNQHFEEGIIKKMWKQWIFHFWSESKSICVPGTKKVQNVLTYVFLPLYVFGRMMTFTIMPEYIARNLLHVNYIILDEIDDVNP
eukprot:1036510_1